MHFVIMGCGRVGASLARSLDRAGHDVAIIDQTSDAFRRLGTDFGGRTVTGMGFDRETLEAAGITKAYAFAAVSSGDNSNIIAARVARERYQVEHVVARIYDPGRAEIYQRLGIPTVGTVKWSSDQIMRRLLPQGHVPEYTDPSGMIVVADVPFHLSWVGERITRVEELTGSRVAYVSRLGDGFLPGPDTVVQDGDFLHLAMTRADVAHVEQILDQAPPDE